MKGKINGFLSSRYERYHTKKTNQILFELKNNYCLPEYNPKKWDGLHTNCYAYALDIPVSDPIEQIWTPGQISSKKQNHHFFTRVTDEVKRDLDYLGISYRENDDSLRLGEWRIAIYYRPTFHDMPLGFHVSRQDSDGCWSEKTGWSKKGKLQRFNSKTDTPPDLSEYNIHLESILILSK